MVRIQLNEKKSITFGRVERNPVLTCEGTVIPIQDKLELRGITLNSKFKFEGQISKICHKVSQHVAVLNRLKKILPFEDRYIPCFHSSKSGDVIKIKFVKLWDLSRYSERTTSKTPTCQKLAFRGKLSLRY